MLFSLRCHVNYFQFPISGPPANVDKDIKGYNLNKPEAEALDAAVTTHEGAHAGIIGLPWRHGEHAGYYTGSVTYQGLHITDIVNYLWDEAWLVVDKDKLSIEKDREQSIQQAIHPPKQEKPGEPQ